MVITGAGAAKSPLVPAHVRGPVASTRALLGVLGFAFAVIGIVVAWMADSLTGMAFLIVGAFLLILPFTRPREDE